MKISEDGKILHVHGLVEHSKNGQSTKGNLQIQHNPHQNSNTTFTDLERTIFCFIRKTQDS